ncbi:MAG: 16S rRNA (adenine(1518)-N(6)/adenine(1519)-N(6))-dimethyltransferase RsmA [Deltaproteobacteria bacterium]|jgi:16S rRNA (adenine1518-N6/adenine1519-N6)-dimethyltransferase|nr:16S rRNA (adenine(1518)-N(6)/adenine(1519)-N(6))-dimethyltransferase RsmA [Deltaproteobacteria bacterium]
MESPRKRLGEMGLAPSRARGQNFIRDPSVAGKIADLVAGEARAGGLAGPLGVVEVGPGLGALTGPLLGRGLRVTAVEVDRGLAEALGRWPEAGEGLTVLGRDVLGLDLERDLGGGERVVCGNLPYNLSTPILFWFMDQARVAPRGIFMLQREMARRLVAGCGGREYGRLSVAVSLWYEARTVLAVPAEAFRPRPRVESSVVLLRLRGEPPTAGERAALGRLTAAAFFSRRKTILNNLVARYGRAVATEALGRLGIDPGLRAEALDPATLAALAGILEAGGPDG